MFQLLNKFRIYVYPNLCIKAEFCSPVFYLLVESI
jgi:hypothetical protein